MFVSLFPWYLFVYLRCGLGFFYIYICIFFSVAMKAQEGPLSVHPSVHPFVCPSILSVFSFCLFVCLPIHNTGINKCFGEGGGKGGTSWLSCREVSERFVKTVRGWVSL